MKNVSFYSTFFYFVTELNFNLKFSNPIVICIVISRTPRIPRSVKKLIERDLSVVADKRSFGIQQTGQTIPETFH